MEDSNKLFSDIKFVISQCNNVEEIKTLLIEGGAKHINYLSEHVTLVIADTNCPEVEEAVELFDKPVVSTSWVHLSLIAKKLLPIEAFSPIRSIFYDVVASFSSDLSTNDVDILAATLTFYGAKVSKETSSATHFIVPSSNSSDLLSKSALYQNLKIVAPDWILDSVRLKHLCDERLYDPSLLLPPKPPTPLPCPSPKTNLLVKESTTDILSSQNVAESGESKTTVDNRPSNQLQAQPKLQSQQSNQPRQPIQPLPTSQLPRPRMLTNIIRGAQPKFRPLLNPDSSLTVGPRPGVQQYSTVGLDSQQPKKVTINYGQYRKPGPYPSNIDAQPQQAQQQQQAQVQQIAYTQTSQHPISVQHQSGNMVQNSRPPQPNAYQIRGSYQGMQPKGPTQQSAPQQQQAQVVSRFQDPSAVVNQRYQVGLQPQAPGSNYQQGSIQRQQVYYPHSSNQMQVRTPQYPYVQPQVQSQTQTPQPQPSPQPQPQPQSQAQTILDSQLQTESQNSHQIQSHLQSQQQFPQQFQQQFSTQPQYQQQFQQQPQYQQQFQPKQQYQQQFSQQQQYQPQYHSQTQFQPQHPTQQTDTQSQPQLQLQRQLQSQSQFQNHAQSQSHFQSPAQPQSQPPSQFQNQFQTQGQFQNQGQFQTSGQFQPQSQYQQQSQAPFQAQPQQQSQYQSAQSQPQYSAQSQVQAPFLPQSQSPSQYQTHPQSPAQLQSPTQYQATPHFQSQHTHQQQPQPHPQLQVQPLFRPQNQMNVQSRTQLQHSMSANQVRPNRALFGLHQEASKASGDKLVNSSHSPMLAPATRASSNVVRPSPQPLVLDSIQESNLSRIRAKIPLIKEDVEYMGYGPKENIPKDLPLIGCRFKLTDYEDISPVIKNKWCEVIKSAGGTFDENIEAVTHLICEDRFSSLYSEAIKLKIRCITIYWINDVLAQNSLMYPWKALHFPLPFPKRDRPLKDQIISFTNLKSKELREVKEMVLKTGAKFTEYFSNNNTLIICGNVGGEKYERAVEWRVPIANCWILIDLLLSGGSDLNAMLTESKYQLFNLKDPLKLYSYSRVRELMNAWLKPLIISEVKKNGSENIVFGASSNLIKTHESNDDSGVVTSGSNASDQDAVALKGRLIPVDAINIENSQSVAKAPVSIDDAKTKDQVSVIDDKPVESNNLSTKKRRKSNDPIRILLTHLNSTITKQLESFAQKLGLLFANNPLECSHLIVDRISRTPKFVCAFSRASYILSYKWIMDSYESNEILDEQHYILEDKNGEETYSFSLVYSMLKRKKREKLLFSNMVFFVTPSVIVRIPSLKEMIVSAGGTATTKKLPSKLQLGQLKLDNKRFVVVTCHEDYNLFLNYDSSNIDLVSFEFIISGILRQDIDFESHRLKLPSSPFIPSVAVTSASTSQLSPPKKLRLNDSPC